MKNDIHKELTGVTREQAASIRAIAPQISLVHLIILQRLISAETVSDVLPTGNKPSSDVSAIADKPTTERQARPFTISDCFDIFAPDRGTR